MAKAPQIFMILPGERYMWWMKFACHLESACLTAQSKLRLSFPWEFSQRHIKMLYDLASLLRSQSFSQFLLIVVEETALGPLSWVGTSESYLRAQPSNSKYSQPVIKHHWPRIFLFFLPHLRIPVGDEQFPCLHPKQSGLKVAGPCQVIGILAFKIITFTQQRKACLYDFGCI